MGLTLGKCILKIPGLPDREAGWGGGKNGRQKSNKTLTAVTDDR